MPSNSSMTRRAPAAYVRALDLTVERLEQTYLRLPDNGSHQGYDYTAPVFDFACRLVYEHGLDGPAPFGLRGLSPRRFSLEERAAGRCRYVVSLAFVVGSRHSRWSGWDSAEV